MEKEGKFHIIWEFFYIKFCKVDSKSEVPNSQNFGHHDKLNLNGDSINKNNQKLRSKSTQLSRSSNESIVQLKF